MHRNSFRTYNPTSFNCINNGGFNMKHMIRSILRAILGTIVALILIVVVYILLPITYTLQIGDINTDYVNNQKPTIIAVLQLADFNDTVELDINSRGGYADEAFLLVNEMKNSSATVVTHVTYRAFSAGAIIAMGGDRIKANESSSFLFHMPFYLAGNPFEPSKVLVTKDDPMYTVNINFMQRYVFPCLTQDELDLYLNDKGDAVIIDGKNMLERIEKYKKFRDLH